MSKINNRRLCDNAPPWGQRDRITISYSDTVAQPMQAMVIAAIVL